MCTSCDPLSRRHVTQNSHTCTCAKGYFTSSSRLKGQRIFYGVLCKQHIIQCCYAEMSIACGPVRCEATCMTHVWNTLRFFTSSLMSEHSSESNLALHHNTGDPYGKPAFGTAHSAFAVPFWQSRSRTLYRAGSSQWWSNHTWKSEKI